MKITVLGAGSWGTALSKVLVENGHDVLIWGNDEQVANEINHYQRNERYLKDITLPNELQATTHLLDALELAEMVLIVLPTRAVREVTQRIGQLLLNLNTVPIIVHATKGLEPQTHLRMSQVIEEVLPREAYQDLVVLSGPSHAEEVARQDITTIAAASQSLSAAKIVQKAFMNQYFRVYTNDDVIGVELGAALKNIIAIGAGLLAGLGYGDNAKAALITRGLAEITRLGVKLGANSMTFLGLSGVGDLIVTCTSVHSRNWQAGNLLAKGLSKDEIEQKVDMVVEGISTTQVAYELGLECGVELPITHALYRALYEGESTTKVIQMLMAREGKQE